MYNKIDATTWEESTARKPFLYGEKPGHDDYYEWRDSRVSAFLLSLIFSLFVS